MLMSRKTVCESIAVLSQNIEVFSVCGALGDRLNAVFENLGDGFALISVAFNR